MKFPFVLRSTMEREVGSLKQKNHDMELGIHNQTLRDILQVMQGDNKNFQEAFFRQMNDTLDPFGDLNSTMRIIATNLPEITAALVKIKPTGPQRNKRGRFAKAKK